MKNKVLHTGLIINRVLHEELNQVWNEYEREYHGNFLIFISYNHSHTRQHEDTYD